MDATEFFATARERQAIYLRRQVGQPWPWTQDPVMQKYSITNVFRENDKTTRWFRTNVREPLRDKPEVLLATVLFRWFNRITTGEAIFKQTGSYSVTTSEIGARFIDYDSVTAWEVYRDTGDTDALRQSIVAYCGKGPYVTGSYIILGQQGMPKLDGVLKCLEMFYGGLFEEQFAILDATKAQHGQMLGWRDVGKFLLASRGLVSLEEVWRWLRQVPYLGDFMAYEIVTDLRWTDLLSSAPDINTWANPGPGAARGLARLYGREIHGRDIKKLPKRQLIDEMRELLALSRKPEYWPQLKRNSTKYKSDGYVIEPRFRYENVWCGWPAWELHEVEMWLCEYDKIMRVRTGEGRPRGTYRHA